MIPIILRSATLPDNMMHSLGTDLLGQFLPMTLPVVNAEVDPVVAKTATGAFGLQGVVVASEFGAGAVQALGLPVFVEGLAIGEAGYGG